MTLAAGSKLGHFEILAPAGAGGMGEVYRARDTRLDRTVAIKILPAQFSADPVRRQRFEREAKTISGLNHPHICVLHDIGHQEGTEYLVMECVEGETLARRLERGALPLEQAVRYGAQIADALDRAHRSGVVHRDLKPGNIMLTKSGVKLLDFGLAKPVTEAFEGGKTLSSGGALTAEGTIVGTVQYMSPEQLEGKPTDARTDLFSFGAVLYEMVTGRKAFEGKSQASLVAAVLGAEPAAMSGLQPLAPAGLERLVRICLVKDPEERIQTAHDVKLELGWIAEGGSQAGLPMAAGRGGLERMAWMVSAGLAAALLVVGATWWMSARRSPPAAYFNAVVPFPANDVTLAPDGKTAALVAYSDQANDFMIWTYEVGGRAISTVRGTDGASHPFWSPDGRSLGFFSNGKLKRADLRGGAVQVLADAPQGRGGAWSRDGIILFAPSVWGGLFKVPAAGGTPEEVTHPDASRSRQSDRWPYFLPDGRHFLYLTSNFSGDFEANAICAGSLDSSEKKEVLKSSSNAAYAAGYLFYVRDNALVAQRFDPRNFTVSGEPHTVSDAVQYLPRVDLAVFDVAANGTVVAQTGKGATRSQFTWFDRSGRPAGTVGAAGAIANPRLSPDGRRVAFDQTDPEGRAVDIWIRELTGDAQSRFTFGPAYNTVPIWSPDGRRILYQAQQKLFGHISVKNADGSGAQQEIAVLGMSDIGWDWSQDGRYLLILKGQGLWYLTMPDGQPKPFLDANWSVRNAQFSPDGKWVAYASNESGNWEVYVSPFPTPGSKWQVSTAGGREPRWRHDGKELFYLSANGKMMAVEVKTGAGFEAGAQVALFQTNTAQANSSQDVFSYDVTRDGQKFLVNTRVAELNTAPLLVILNWASELEK